jgi:hypothetical protein
MQRTPTHLPLVVHLQASRWGGDWRFGVGCGRTDSYTFALSHLTITQLYPNVVGHQCLRHCFNSARRYHFSLVVLHGLCQFSFKHVGIPGTSSFVCNLSSVPLYMGSP